MANGLSQDFGPALASFTFFEIAARDPHLDYPHAFGCDHLLQAWIKAPDPKLHAAKPTRQFNCAFDRLAANLTYGSTS